MALLALVGCGAGEMVADPLVADARVNPLSLIEQLPRISFDGVVAERLEAGSYTYLRLDDGRWVVGLDHGHVAGDPVTVVPFGVSRDFVSARTGRTFDTLVFGVLSARPE